MSGMELIVGLQFIGDDLIEETGLDAVPKSVGFKASPIRRAFLIAAVIAVFMVLVGCAVAVASLIFGSPKEMISALYGKDAGFSSAPATQATDPWKEGSAWTVPGYEKQPAEPAVAKKLEKWVSPVGAVISDGEDTLTVDAFIYDSVTRSGLITILWEHEGPLDPMLGYNGELGTYPVKINQYGRAYLIPEKTTEDKLAFTYYFHMDIRSGDSLRISFPDKREKMDLDALEALRSLEVPKIRQRLMTELTPEEASAQCRQLFGFSGNTGEYDDYYFLAANEFDTAHAEDYTTQYARDMAEIEQQLRNSLSPEEALAQLEALWGKELIEETLEGRGQEDAQEMAYFFLTKRECERTHTENTIFVPLSDNMKLPNRSFGGGTVLTNGLSLQVSHTAFPDGGCAKEMIIHMQDGSDFVVVSDTTNNALYTLTIHHGDILYMLNSAINIDNIQSIEIDGQVME